MGCGVVSSGRGGDRSGDARIASHASTYHDTLICSRWILQCQRRSFRPAGRAFRWSAAPLCWTRAGFFAGQRTSDVGDVGAVDLSVPSSRRKPFRVLRVRQAVTLSAVLMTSSRRAHPAPVRRTRFTSSTFCRSFASQGARFRVAGRKRGYHHRARGRKTGPSAISKRFPPGRPERPGKGEAPTWECRLRQ